MQPIIQTEGLTKAYGAARVLSGIDLTIAPGERVALIGANGSGKSTLMKCLIGLLPVTEGEITTLGQRFSRLPSTRQRVEMRQQMGFVFQNHCLVRRRTVLSNVVHGMLGAPGSWRGFAQAIAPRAWRDRAMEALEDVGLADRAMARADTLSGGQQQRVAIARALIRRPKLLIADEPAASLDPVAGRDVMSLFARLAEAHGITLLYSSHDMVHAREFSDRVIALKDGGLLLDRASGAVGDGALRAAFAGGGDA
ncbi:MAG: ATP-binding cassette domain-containing protein [Pseudomonadota bacterium]